MLTYSVFLGALLFIIGLATYVYAPRVGPNPIFGVRVGYSFASREVWDKTNRFGGRLIAWTGIGLVLLALMLNSLSVAPGTAMLIQTGVMIIALLAETLWMVAYARGLAQGTTLACELAPVKFRWTYLAPVFATFLLLVALAAYFYPSLPAGRLATHFDITGTPDGWMSRDGFILFFLGLALSFLVLDLLVVFVATREPLIAVGRWGSRWWLDPERGLLFLGWILGVTNLMFALALLDTVWFNVNSSHLFPVSAFLGIVIVLIGIIIGLFFLMARKNGMEQNT